MLNPEKRVKIFLKKRKIRRETPQIWLLPQAKFGYIQIPKVASRSIRAGIIEMARREMEYSIPQQSKSDAQVEKIFSSHMPHKKLAELSKEYFLFAFVRNPLTRLYSAYMNKLIDPQPRGGRNIFSHMDMPIGMAFESFVKRVAELKDNEIDRHLRPQRWFLTCEGRLFTNYVGKMETFSADWTVLQNKFSLPCLSHKNSSSAMGMQTGHRFTRRLAEIAIERYKDDIELFGYGDQVRQFMDGLN